MPSYRPSPLNCQTFFKFWACKAFSTECYRRLTDQDRCTAQVAALIFGFLTLGIGTVICMACIYDRKIISSSQTLKFRKIRLEKVFAGSNDDKKIQEINFLVYRLHPDSDSIKKKDIIALEKEYNLIKNINTNKNFCDFLLKNHNLSIQSDFKLYTYTREICDLLNQNAEDNRVKIDTLLQKLGNFSTSEYFKIILTYCDFEKAAHHALHGNKRVKESFIEYLSSLDFTEFREKYKYIKKIALHEEVHPDSNRSNTMAFACDVLDALDCDPEERNIRLQTLRTANRSLQDINSDLLWKLLALHCEIKDIPFLISYRFGFKVEEITMRTFFGNLIHHSNVSKWQLLLPHVWSQINKFRLTLDGMWILSPITKIFRSLENKEKFQIVFQSLLQNLYEHPKPENLNLITKCINYTNSEIPLLPFPKRFEIVKNTLWPKCVQWSKETQNCWYMNPINYFEIMEPHQEFVEGIYTSLHQLLLKFKEQKFTDLETKKDLSLQVPNDSFKSILSEMSCSDSTIALLLTSKTHYQQLSPLILQYAEKKILEIIETVKLFNEKMQTLSRKRVPLISDIDNLETLLKSFKYFPPGALIRLKDLLEMAVFHAVMREQPFQLFQEKKESFT